MKGTYKLKSMVSSRSIKDVSFGHDRPAPCRPRNVTGIPAEGGKASANSH